MCIYITPFKTADSFVQCWIVQLVATSRHQYGALLVLMIGYSFMITSTFNRIMGMHVTIKQDALYLVLAVVFSFGVTVALNEVVPYTYIPPVAVILAGSIYFTLSLAQHMAGLFYNMRYKSMHGNGFYFQFQLKAVHLVLDSPSLCILLNYTLNSNQRNCSMRNSK